MEPSSVHLRNRDDVKRIKQCRVVFSYKQDHEDELNLNVGDVIDILGEEEEGWWRGCINGREGVFPSNFVEEIVNPYPNSHPGSKEHLADIGSNSISAPHPQKIAAKIFCEVKYQYKAQNEDELTLKEGDIVVLLSKSGQDAGWWKGELNGVVGVFPDNFVSIVPSVDDKLSSKDDGTRKHKPHAEPVAIKHTAVSSQRKSLEIQNVDRTQDAETAITKASPPVPSKKPSIPIKKSPSSSGGAGGILQGLRKKIVDVVDGATGSKSAAPPKTEVNHESAENAFDNVVRRPLLSDVRATRPKAPGRRLPTSIYKEQYEPGVMNGSSEHVAKPEPEIGGGAPPEPANSSPEPDATDGKPKLREWEKHKAPWLAEMKLNQAKRTSTSPGPPEHRLKLTPTDRGQEGETPAKPEPAPQADPPKTAPPSAKTPPNEPERAVSVLRSKPTAPTSVARPQTIHGIEPPHKPAATVYPKMAANLVTSRTPSPLQKTHQSDRGSTEMLDTGETAISQLLDRVGKLEETVKKQKQEYGAALDDLRGKLQIETEMRMELQAKLETFLADSGVIHEL